ncbi:MAG: hypothetical protein JWP01_3156 [Myxococcales bacterium]|nr:hypothetical protein [Myxococcales bacterium]
MPVRPATPALASTTASARGAARIDLDWDALEIAVERNSPDTDSYLDLTTGRVLTITTGDPEATINRQQVSENIRNFLRVEPASSREQYRWMERFVGSVVDEPLRERLIISIDGKGAFRRFKDVLLAYPAERERWFSYRADLLHWHIQNWLESHEIQPTNEPPWGAVVAPQELPAVGRAVVHGTEAPGESLRRQARDLIETIAAIELPTAIAFLEFLKLRSSDPTAKADAERDREHDEAADSVS